MNDRRPTPLGWLAFLGFTSGPLVTLTWNVFAGQLVTAGTGIAVCLAILRDMDRVMPNPDGLAAIDQNRRWLATTLKLALLPLVLLFVTSAVFLARG